jgi:hypothetical protein
MSVLVEDVLDAWREAERLLEALPPHSPDREPVTLAIERLRTAYADMTATSDATAAALASASDTLVRARRLLDLTRQRTDRSAR